MILARSTSATSVAVRRAFLRAFSAAEQSDPKVKSVCARYWKIFNIFHFIHCASHLVLCQPSLPVSSDVTTSCNRVYRKALIIKKKNDPIAADWLLRMAEHLKTEFGIISYVEPAVAAECSALPSVVSLQAENPESVAGWDSYNSSGTISDFDADQFYDQLWSALPTADQPETRSSGSWQSQIDLAIAIGGDGTLLHLSSLFPRRCPPVVSFHCGSLGFLMSFDPDDHPAVFDVCLRGEQPILPRLRMEFCVQSEEEWHRLQRPSAEAKWRHLLNETVLKRQHRLTGFSEIEAYVDDDFLARFKGDGLILASPTGSTAYSMAAGGSIVHPEIDAMLLTPLNSTSLASRPLLLPGSASVRLHIRTESVYLEGKYGRYVSSTFFTLLMLVQSESRTHLVCLTVGEIVLIRKSKYPLPCFTRDNPTSDFIYDLSHRLMYQRRIRGTPESAKRVLVPHFKQTDCEL
jgi:NADH kinase